MDREEVMKLIESSIAKGFCCTPMWSTLQTRDIRFLLGEVRRLEEIHIVEHDEAVKQFSRADELQEENTQLKAKLMEAKQVFMAHLDTMSDINSHMGYPFSQPLIGAWEALARIEEGK